MNQRCLSCLRTFTSARNRAPGRRRYTLSTSPTTTTLLALISRFLFSTWIYRPTMSPTCMLSDAMKSPDLSADQARRHIARNQLCRQPSTSATFDAPVTLGDLVIMLPIDMPRDIRLLSGVIEHRVVALFALRCAGSYLPLIRISQRLKCGVTTE